MTGIDIGLFDYDRHNAVYFFILNADEDIYLRYGGREPESGETYLDLDSLIIALKLGLAEHERYEGGRRVPQKRPAPFFPRDIGPLKRNEMDRGRCVECHLIADYQAQEKEEAGTLNPVRDLYRSPDIKTIGIYLDIPRGLVVKEASGAVRDAGLEPGDLVASLNSVPLLTYGDLLYRYDKVRRDATSVILGIERAGTHRDLRVSLPPQWWRVDTYYRFWTVEPLTYFYARTLTVDEKVRHGFKPKGFASEITQSDPGAIPLGLHSLKKRDIIYAVDGVEEDAFTDDLELYIKLNKIAGEPMKVSLIRDGRRRVEEIRTHREYYRKRPPRW